MTYLKSLLTTTVFTAVAIAFAFGISPIVNTAARGPLQVDPTASPSVEVTLAPTPTATVPTDDPTDEENEVDDETEGENEDGHTNNHGAVVSVAAKCPIKGRAHGELVSSIARDKDATVAEAEAACAAAIAAQAAAGETTDERGKPADAGKPADVGRPDHAGPPGDDESETVETSDEGGDLDDASSGDDDSHEPGPPAHAGGGRGKP